MEIFTELDHRLSVVKRWPILHTIQTQSVAEHAFNVSRIAERIAFDWFKIGDGDVLYNILWWALHHDDLEALTSDLPSMVKPYFDEDKLAHEHSSILVPALPPSDQVRDIVKLADKMEGYHFLAMEVALGNQFVRAHYAEEIGIISRHTRKTFGADIGMKMDDWLYRIREEPLASTRHSMRGR